MTSCPHTYTGLFEPARAVRLSWGRRPSPVNCVSRRFVKLERPDCSRMASNSSCVISTFFFRIVRPPLIIPLQQSQNAYHRTREREKYRDERIYPRHVNDLQFDQVSSF